MKQLLTNDSAGIAADDIMVLCPLLIDMEPQLHSNANQWQHPGSHIVHAWQGYRLPTVLQEQPHTLPEGSSGRRALIWQPGPLCWCLDSHAGCCADSLTAPLGASWLSAHPYAWLLPSGCLAWGTSKVGLSKSLNSGKLMQVCEEGVLPTSRAESNCPGTRERCTA